ncbi:right-handed parallel beta-helix repeat-containing protein, partial [Candidatus Babeliales bacterium]|nr:right-handed parallel beta-helix repeat-containing protein [Candidatus Babeliales bacterium]
KTGRAVTFVVAASDSEHKDEADYVCDGVDDQVEIQAAIDALPAGGGHIFFLDGNYYIDTINLVSDLTLEGQGPSTVFHPKEISTTMFKALGTQTEITTLSVSTIKGATTLNVTNASSLAANDWILINSDRTTFYRNAIIGETHQISSIAGNVVTLIDKMFDYYNTADNAKVHKIDFFHDIHVKNLKVVGLGKDTGNIGLFIIRGKGVHIKDCIVKECGSVCVYLRDSILCSVRNCSIGDATASMSGYGVDIGNCSQFNVVEGCEFSNCTHCTTLGGDYLNGIPRFNYHINNIYRSGLEVLPAAADQHYGDYAYYLNNHFIGCNVAMNAGAVHTIIDGCTFDAIGTTSQTVIHPRSDDAELRDLIVVNCKFSDTGIPMDFHNCTKMKRFDISGNIIKNANCGSGTSAIWVRNIGSEDFERVNICNNLIQGIVGSGIGVHISSTGENKRVVVKDNILEDITNYGIFVSGNDIQVDGNHLENVNIDNDFNYPAAIRIVSEYCKVSSNKINGYYRGGIMVAGTGVIQDNVILGDRSSHADYGGILISNTNKVLVNGNKIISPNAASIREMGTSNYNHIADNYLSKCPVLLGANSRMYEQYSDLFMDVLAASANAVHAAIVGTGAEQEITTAITNPDVPRNVS